MPEIRLNGARMAAPDVTAGKQVLFNRKFRMTSSGESRGDRRDDRRRRNSHTAAKPDTDRKR